MREGIRRRHGPTLGPTAGVLLHNRSSQVGLFHWMYRQLGVGAATDPAGQRARVDHQRAEHIFGKSIEAGGKNQHVGVDLELPVLRVAQVVLLVK